METIKQVVIDSLRKAFTVHESLGVRGEELVQKNQFGDTALVVDIEAEKAVLDFLKQSGVSIRVISEEHGTTEITKNPCYLGILDGLDGTSVYKKKRGWGKYGTMFGIFSNTDPLYEDYLACGVMEHSTGRLFIASKGGGAHIVRGDSAVPIKSIKCSGRKTLDRWTRIYIDEDSEMLRETFSKKLKGFHTHFGGSAAIYYVNIASSAADLAIQRTQKFNLEMAIGYGLVVEAGAVMVDIDGKSMGEKRYLNWGQTEHLPIITAATRDLALRLIEHIRR